SANVCARRRAPRRGRRRRGDRRGTDRPPPRACHRARGCRAPGSMREALRRPLRGGGRGRAARRRRRRARHPQEHDRRAPLGARGSEEGRSDRRRRDRDGSLRGRSRLRHVVGRARRRGRRSRGRARGAARVRPRSPAPHAVTGVRAAVMTEPGRIEVETFARPDPEPGALLIQVVYSGVCGTDKHTFRGETIQYAGTPHERRLEYPLICGHENVGVVVETGGDVLATDGRPLRPGDRIVPGANVACGECWFCREGFPYYACERLEDYGNSLNAARPPHLFGWWAELMYLLPGTPLFRVPDELPSEVAVLTEVMAVTHGLDNAAQLPLPHTFRPGSSVAVIGVGPLGLCHLIKARFLGCGELMAVDLLPSRLRVAERFGATLTIE